MLLGMVGQFLEFGRFICPFGPRRPRASTVDYLAQRDNRSAKFDSAC